MTDLFLLRMIEALVTPLSENRHGGDSPCTELIPSYNAILSMVQANHPDDPFLGLLSPIDKGGFLNTSQLLALFGQLRIVMEFLSPAPEP